MKVILARKLLLGVFLFIAFYFGICASGLCQVGDPGGDPDVPIGGIEWLILGGFVIGARKLFSTMRKR